MVLKTMMIETLQPPLIEDWPLQEEVVPLAERIRRLSEDPRGFREWLQARKACVVGTSHDGRRCPFANFLHTELGWENSGSLYVSSGQTGTHDCTQGQCEGYAHIEHPRWVRSFILAVDSRRSVRGVRGSEAVDLLDAVLQIDERRRRLGRLPRAAALA